MPRFQNLIRPGYLNSPRKFPKDVNVKGIETKLSSRQSLQSLSFCDVAHHSQ